MASTTDSQQPASRSISIDTWKPPTGKSGARPAPAQYAESMGITDDLYKRILNYAKEVLRGTQASECNQWIMIDRKKRIEWRENLRQILTEEAGRGVFAWNSTTWNADILEHFTQAAWMVLRETVRTRQRRAKEKTLTAEPASAT